jgi:hypothetical protein
MQRTHPQLVDQWDQNGFLKVKNDALLLHIKAHRIAAAGYAGSRCCPTASRAAHLVTTAEILLAE